uniref:Uncharacterized protein n=1 Tax=Lactuca sativa TaxID=4236 RepID=A0A9R1XXQ7_LACSA|nr:hypothetical protein LSAT_V11C100042450 [Lactuca sativa]
MCSGPEPNKSASSSSSTTSNSNKMVMSPLTVETEDSFSSLLEYAANNDYEAFKRSIENDPSAIDEVGMWYVRKKGSKQIVLEHRTPLMVASTYGSINVLKLIISQPKVDVNFACGPDKFTALHCATSGGSPAAIEAVKLLLSVGADPNLEDVNGHRPVDVIVVPPKLSGVKASIEGLLMNNGLTLSLTMNMTGSWSPTMSSSPENGSGSCSPVMSKFENEIPFDRVHAPIPMTGRNVRLSILEKTPAGGTHASTITAVSRVPILEKARVDAVTCANTRTAYSNVGFIPRNTGHDGTSCARRVCFFAHMPEELRPLYVSTGSAVPSPRSAAAGATVMDMAAALNLLPGSPSSMSMSMSPTGNSPWPQPNVPTLHLPGSNLQSSRLRSSLSARDIPPEDLSLLRDFDSQLLNEFACFSQSRSSRSRTALAPANLEDLFSSEIGSSPRYSDQVAAGGGGGGGVFSPSHKSTVLNSVLSPINTNSLLHSSFGVSSPGRMSPRSMDHSPMAAAARLSAFNHREQLRSLSSRDFTGTGSPVGHNTSSSWSKWGSPTGKVDWSVNGEEFGKLKRSSSFELKNNGGGGGGGGGGGTDEPDLSWVQSLVKESPPEMMKNKAAAPPPTGGGAAAPPSGEDHSVLGAWLEQMQLDQLVA